MFRTDSRIGQAGKDDKVSTVGQRQIPAKLQQHRICLYQQAAAANRQMVGDREPVTRQDAQIGIVQRAKLIGVPDVCRSERNIPMNIEERPAAACYQTVQDLRVTKP